MKKEGGGRGGEGMEARVEMRDKPERRNTGRSG
jgi:hypothetical protein